MGDYAYYAYGAIDKWASNNNVALSFIDGGGWGGQQYNFNAEWVSNRYGNYTEVNPLYESTRYIIKY